MKDKDVNLNDILHAIHQLSGEVKGTNSRLDAHILDMNEFKSDMIKFKSNMIEFKSDMNEFKSDMNEFKSDMNEFKSDMIEFKSDMNEFKQETRERFDKQDVILKDIHDNNEILIDENWRNKKNIHKIKNKMSMN